MKELYLTSNPNAPGPNLTDLYRDFRLDSIDQFHEPLGNYLAYRDRIGSDHAFADRVSFAHFTGQHLASLDQTIGEAAQEYRCSRPGGHVDWSAPVVEGLDGRVCAERTELDALAQTVADPTVWAVLTRMAAGSLPENVVATFAKANEALHQIDVRGLLQTADTNGLTERLRQGLTARQSVFNWFFYKDKPYLTALTQQHSLGMSLTDLQQLTRAG